ncbi:NAD(P)/FAD-dependent oxidoreductase [Gymnodinialimonas sp. 2305UL16-5]|uniref:flavin monoamine oxidase family protein n=1 Tax=Gymnodinialimonas mytili TaxID=3126503 RepID=UPI0030A49F76
MQTDILIIGGGLAGLSLAVRLAERGADFRLLEARDRLGGRILTERHGDGQFDMGPAWFWPGQPRIADMIDRLGLLAFDQHWQGAVLFEDPHGQIQRGRGFASMQGSYRLDGGMGALIAALAGQLPPDRIQLAHPIRGLERIPDGVTAIGPDGQAHKAKRVVLALPPRLAAELCLVPSLPTEVLEKMRGVATWMAGQAKAVALYDRPFWREQGLSGDAISQRGPLAEIHDASPARGEPYALFGFLGLPPQSRQDKPGLRDAIAGQLARIFGPEATQPQKIALKDWAFDAFTSTDLDLQPLRAHPTYELPPELDGLWNGRLIFGGTEVAPDFGGYLEGALEAAEGALTSIDR